MTSEVQGGGQLYSQITILGPELDRQVAAALARLAGDNVIARIWLKDHTVWKPDPTEITNRLGWLTITEPMLANAGDLAAFAREVRDDGIQDVVLLGMGGSSLAPGVMRASFGRQGGWPQLHVLDSTVPARVARVAEAIDPARSLFIVSSKSGATVETLTLYKYFFGLVRELKGKDAGRNFIAITDPGSYLADLAATNGFRHVFVNDPDIGGRYSVLSYFGMAPAALAGLDARLLLERGQAMAQACRRPPLDNPAAWLGAVVATLAQMGRDKVTFITSPAVETFGLWAEQLIAESTGKEGKGILPIALEPLAPVGVYGSDRLFAYLRLDEDDNEAVDQQAAALEAAGQPLIRIRLRDRYDLATEFYRWEFATAVAGAMIGIQPFDQPNVQDAKDKTNAVLRQVKETGQIPALESTGRLRDLLELSEAGDYLAIMAYVDGNDEVDEALTVLREAVLERYRLPNTMGYGPRFLHSTGQLHKGGPNNGLFLQLAADYSDDLPVPDADYTFAGLVSAQAAGDYQALEDRGRRIIRLNLGREVAQALRNLRRNLRGFLA